MPAPLFEGRIQISTVVTSTGLGDYMLGGVYYDDSSNFTADDIAVDDVITDADGHSYQILEINTTTSWNVADVCSGGVPVTGAANICRPTTNGSYLYPTRVSNGISEWLYNEILNTTISLLQNIPDPDSCDCSDSTAYEMLREVEVAISNALKGKTVSVDGQSYTAHDIDKLMAVRKTLKAEVIKELGLTRTVSYANMSRCWE